MNKMISGGIAGFVATAPMTIAMELMHKQLPPQESYPLPPREITEKITEEAGIRDDLSDEEREKTSLVAHFAYGTACGAVYSLAEKALPGPPAARGIGFGLAVWTGSYLGLLPELGILKSAKNHPARRNALMIAAHVVWGASTGILAHKIAGDADQ